MSPLPLVVITLLLTLQMTIISSQATPQQTPYASQQQLNNLNTELNGRIDTVEKELEEEKEFIQNEMSYWQRALLSLTNMLNKATSGSYLQQLLYWTQQKESFDKIGDTVDELKGYVGIGTPKNPVSSCKELRPNSTNGHYWLKDPQGNVSKQYCAMDLDGCGTRGGWMRVAFVDMTRPDHNCPTEFSSITTPKRLCGRAAQTGQGCVSTTFPTNQFSYNQVCGKVIAYQNNTPDGNCPYYLGSRSIEGVYIDGVSLTHGNPRSHIWSFIAGNGEYWPNCLGCACFNTTILRNSIPFVGNNFFCDTGERRYALATKPKFYGEDPLWDGDGCGPVNHCCNFNNPPWFSTTLNETTTDKLEMRICGNEGTANEDTPIEQIELYVK